MAATHHRQLAQGQRRGLRRRRQERLPPPRGHGLHHPCLRVANLAALEALAAAEATGCRSSSERVASQAPGLAAARGSGAHTSPAWKLYDNGLFGSQRQQRVVEAAMTPRCRGAKVGSRAAGAMPRRREEWGWVAIKISTTQRHFSATTPPHAITAAPPSLQQPSTPPTQLRVPRYCSHS